MAQEIFAVGATGAVAITKSDTTTYTPQSGGYLSALYVGGAGDVAIMPVGDTTAVTFSAVPAGTVIPVRCQKVMSTNTTATAIVGLRFGD
jgi:hypothetical protein